MDAEESPTTGAALNSLLFGMVLGVRASMLEGLAGPGHTGPCLHRCCRRRHSCPGNRLVMEEDGVKLVIVHDKTLKDHGHTMSTSSVGANNNCSEVGRLAGQPALVYHFVVPPELQAYLGMHVNHNPIGGNTSAHAMPGVEHGGSVGGQELAPGASATDGDPCPPEQGDTGRGGG